MNISSLIRLHDLRVVHSDSATQAQLSPLSWGTLASQDGRERVTEVRRVGVGVEVG